MSSLSHLLGLKGSMLYFKWSGITLLGKIVSGKAYARSESALDTILLHHEIALLKVCPLTYRRRKTAGRKELILFFQQLATLLKSNIRLYDALIMTCHVITNKQLRFIMYDCALQVSAGIPLSTAMHEFPLFFSDFVIHSIKTGEESGNLAQSLAELTNTLQEYHQFRKQIKTALIMPSITIIFFTILFAAIFLIVIPRFKNMIQPHAPIIPPLTRFLFTVSDTLQSPVCIILCLSILITLIGIFLFFKYHPACRPIYDKFILTVPFFNTFLCRYNRIKFLQSLTLLLESGIPLVKALTISGNVVTNTVIKKEYESLAHTVNNGISFTNALAQQKTIYSPELETFIQTGLNSGLLAKMIKEANVFYKSQLHNTISFCITLIQPVMLISMGLLIAILIIALYMPLFNISSVL